MFAYKLNVRGADIILQNLGQHKISDSNLQYSPKLNTGCYRLMLEFSFLIDHFIFNDIVLETTWGFLTVYDLMTAGKNLDLYISSFGCSKPAGKSVVYRTIDASTRALKKTNVGSSSGDIW